MARGVAGTHFHYEDLVADMGSVIRNILTEVDIPDYDFKVTSGKSGSTELSGRSKIPMK